MMKHIRFSFYNVIRSNRNKISVIIIGIFATLCLVINIATNTINNYIEKDTYRGYSYRSLNVSRSLEDVSYEEISEIENDIQSINHVQSSFFIFYYNQGAKIDGYIGNLDGMIELTSANSESVLEILNGTNFPKDDGYYMICPQNFYPNSDTSTIQDLSSKDKYQLEDKLGQTFSLIYNDWITKEAYKIDVKLIGLYKNQPNHFDENRCFVTKNVNEKIAKGFYQSDKTWSIDQYSSFITVVDDIKNIDLVKSELEQKGYYVSLIASISYKYFNNIFNFIKKSRIVIFVLLIIFLILYCRKDFIENQRNYTLLEIIGYNKLQKFLYYISEIIIKLIMSFIISVLMILLLQVILNIILQYKPFIFNKYSIIIDYKFYFVIYLFIFTTSIILYILNLIWKKEKTTI